MMARALIGSSLAIALAVALAACGSSSSSSTTTAGAAGSVATTSGPTLQARVSLARCLRTHGIDVPDPTSTTVSPAALNRAEARLREQYSPTVLNAALASCHSELVQAFPQANLSATQLAQQQHVREQDLLAFATCMRGHGVPRFPDPTSQGQLTVEMITDAGVDLHAPAALTGAQACIGVSNGAITPGDVQRALSGSR